MNSSRKKANSHALLQNCYSFFTLGFNMLTGKNGGDIINLIQDGYQQPLLSKLESGLGYLSRGKA